MLSCVAVTMDRAHRWWDSLQRGAGYVGRRMQCLVEATKVQQGVQHLVDATKGQRRMQRLVNAAETRGTQALGCVRSTMARLARRGDQREPLDAATPLTRDNTPTRRNSFRQGQPLQQKNSVNYLEKCISDKQPAPRVNTQGKEPHTGVSQGRAEENGNYIVLTRDGAEGIQGRGSLTLPRVPCSTQELESYLIHAIHSKELNDQLQGIPLEDKTKNKSVAALEWNKRKNRYKNNIPYDETRVVLHGIPDNDYINASYISCPSGKRYYIAAQGPKGANESTVDDFWLMVWQNNTNVIIMVANLVENGREKVSRYWPMTLQWTEVYGKVKVVLVAEMRHHDYIIRSLLVSVDDCTREVVHYQYMTWPDHGVPSFPRSAARMIKNACEWEWSGPPVIHCSAGLGRTGTILLVLALLNTLKAEGHFDPPHALRMLRMCRPNMLDNQFQYRFAHQVLLMILFGTRTSLPIDKLWEKNAFIKQEFQKLKSFPLNITFDWASIHNSALNRDESVLPADGRQAMLMLPVSQNDGQYVNAVLVRGSNLQDDYIVTEHPMSHTMGRAWMLAFTRHASAWVFLHDHTNLPDRKKFPSVLLYNGHEGMEELTVHVQSQVEKTFFSETTVTVSQITSHTMQVIQFKDWHPSREIPSQTQSLLALVERLWELRQAASYSPIMISCSDGYSASGVLVTLERLMEEVKLTKRVDFFHTVLSVRYDRPQFIKSERQYNFLHYAVIAYHRRITEVRKGRLPADGKEMKRQVRSENGDQNTAGESRNKEATIQTRSSVRSRPETLYSNERRKVRSYYITKNTPAVEDILHDTGKDRDQERRRGSTLPHSKMIQESKEVDAGNTREGLRFVGRKQMKTNRKKSSMEESSPYEYLWQ